VEWKHAEVVGRHGSGWEAVEVSGRQAEGLEDLQKQVEDQEGVRKAQKRLGRLWERAEEAGGLGKVTLHYTSLNYSNTVSIIIFVFSILFNFCKRNKPVIF